MTDKKPTKIRETMTEEQRAAAAERLKLMPREKRAKSNPPTYKNVHPDVLALPEDHPRSFVKVKQWIKENREKLPAIRQQVRANQKVHSLRNNDQRIHCSHGAYLKNGDWVSTFYGANMEKRHIRTCVAFQAYDEDGNPKREKGVFYPDLGFVWGMEDDIS